MNSAAAVNETLRAERFPCRSTEVAEGLMLSELLPVQLI